MSKGVNGLKVSAVAVSAKRAKVVDVLDVFRDKMTLVEVSAGGRDTGPDAAKAHRRTRVEFDEVDGKRTKVTRVIDTLGQMHGRGTITDAMYKAGVAFQLAFDVGQWESMPSMRFDGMPRSGKGGGVSMQIVEARTATLAAMHALGGFRSPCGIAVWWVVGMRWSFLELEQNDTNMSRKNWQGTLIGALHILAVHYNFERCVKPLDVVGPISL